MVFLLFSSSWCQFDCVPDGMGSESASSHQQVRAGYQVQESGGGDSPGKTLLMNLMSLIDNLGLCDLWAIAL